MSDNWGYENSNDFNGRGDNTDMNGPKALREAYEAMKRQNEELQNGLASIQNELRQQKVSAVFNSLGVPQAASLYKGEPDPEKATEWVNTMRSVFGNGNAQGETPPVAEPVMDQETQERFQRMNEAGSNAQPLSAMDAAHAAVNGANDVASLISAFQNATRGG